MSYWQSKPIAVIYTPQAINMLNMNTHGQKKKEDIAYPFITHTLSIFDRGI